MEITEDIKRILKAHEMASIDGFIDSEEKDLYSDCTNFSDSEIISLCDEFSGYSQADLEELTIFRLKNIIKKENGNNRKD